MIIKFKLVNYYEFNQALDSSNITLLKFYLAFFISPSQACKAVRHLSKSPKPWSLSWNASGYKNSSLSLFYAAISSASLGF